MIVGGALASLSDTETSRANSITVATLDLVVNAENPLQSTLIALDNMLPGQYEEVEVQLTNEGSQGGNSWLMFTGLICTTGAYVEPETAIEGDTPIDEVYSKIVVSVNGEEQGTLAELENIIIPLTMLEPDGDRDAGTTVALGFLVMEDVGSEYQGDVCEFTLVFGLDQA